MIERIARALWLLDYPEDHPSWQQDYVRDGYARMARAAIEAMREPTEAMLEAPDEFGVPNGDSSVWRAMIAAALEEP